MAKQYKLSVFIFRRALRLQDNIGLIEALKNSDTVVPIFIFTPEQLTKNTFKSDNCVQFMMESLEDLNDELKKKKSKLYYFYGEQHKIIEKIIKSKKINAVFVNADYTPYAIQRDKKIRNVCKKQDIDFISTEDILLNPIASIVTGQDDIYTKFTPYFNKAKKIKVPNPISNKYSNYYKGNVVGTFKGDMHKFYNYNENILHEGGRKEGLKRLAAAKNQKQYNKKRNDLTYNTTELSAHIKFGTISIREVYHTFKKSLGTKNDLIKQLYWRDFYYNIASAYPYVFKSPGAMKPKYNKIKWEYNRSHFNKWKEGKTGFPIVDAGIRQMNETGFMHNRARLIVASFLVKILLIDWKWGEKYFAQTLYDYDPAVNNGNWQWCSSTGADSQPYFRIFNPWSQGKSHDPDCKYIKKWIPELQDVPSEDIHEWEESWDNYKQIKYPKPIVDYKKKKQKALSAYKKIF